MLLALVLASWPYSAPVPRDCRDRSCVRSRTGGNSGPTLPAFLFAPTNGICDGTALTAATGQTITFARASPISCMKGNETTGIANGDLVTIAAGSPAIQSGGLLAWEPRTNGIIFPRNLSKSAWVKNGGDFTPTVTDNFGVAPDGTSTASRVQIQATTSGQSAYLYQDSACQVGFDAMSCFVKGNVDAGSNVIDIGVNDGSNGEMLAACTYNVSTWTRCLAENVNVLNGPGTSLFNIGNLGFVTGQSRPAQDVLIWGCQCETGTVNGGRASPFIDSLDGGPQTRAKQSATASYTATSSISLGGALTSASMFADGMAVASISVSNGNETDLSILGAKDECTIDIAANASTLNGIANLLTPVTQAAACAYAPTAQVACAASQCKPASGALTLPTGAATLYLGSLVDGGSADGTVTNVCADPSSTKCYPSGASTVACPVVTDNAHTVATVGDSIMVGAFQIQVVDELNDRLCSRGLAAVKYAVSGAAIPDCIVQYHTGVKGQGYRDVLTNCGTNSLNGAPDDTVAWALMSSMLEDITRDGGYHVVLGNVTPCRGYLGCSNTVVQQFNADEANWCADAGNRATCIDNYTLLGTGSSTLSYSSSTKIGILGNMCQPSSDSLHPNNYCTTKMADNFADNVP